MSEDDPGAEKSTALTTPSPDPTKAAEASRAEPAPNLLEGAPPAGSESDPETARPAQSPPPAADDLIRTSGAEATREAEPSRVEQPSEPPVAPTPPVSPAKRRFRWGRALLLLLLIAILWAPVSVLVTKVVLPPATFLMIERMFEGRGLEKHWRPLTSIAPSLATAVIAAEDAKFCEHEGFDWDAMRIAAEHNARSPAKVRGGSTLSQQTAKNVFLWPARDYLRKGLEAGYTVLIEKIWGKRRILEAYLNVVEWGPGLYGAQAAAQRYFHEDAARLTPQQSARLAAILPSPLKWKAVNPGRYVARRTKRIGANAAIVREDDLAWCVR